MKRNTFESYLEEIKKKYGLEKEGKHSSYLSKPSPGSIKDLCSLLGDSDLSKIDRGILNKFLESEKFDLDKFRPICNFFIGKTKTPKQSIVDIMALLVDFKQRPLGRYLKGEISENQNREEGESEERENQTGRQDDKEIKKLFKSLPSRTDNDNKDKKKLFINKPLLIAVSLLIGFLVFLGTTTLIDKKDCLLWKEDHYERATKEEAAQENNGDVTIITNENEHLLTYFRKIKPCDTTTYFKNGKPCIWYGKSPDGEYEYFTAPGQHPLTDKSLNEITEYMINKYLPNKSDK